MHDTCYSLLALDPSLKATGWARIDVSSDDSIEVLDSGVIVPPDFPKVSVQCRMRLQTMHIAARLSVLIAELPLYGVIVSEHPIGGAKSAKAMRAMGMISSIVTTVAYMVARPLFLTTAAQGRKALGQSNKRQVQDLMQQRYSRQMDSHKPKLREHVADAIAAAYAALPQLKEHFDADQ